MSKKKEHKHLMTISRLSQNNIKSLVDIYEHAIRDLQLKLLSYDQQEATYTHITNLMGELDSVIDGYDQQLQNYVYGNQDDPEDKGIEKSKANTKTTGMIEKTYIEGIKSASKVLSVKGNFTNVNHRAIAFLQSYTFDLVKDINDTLRIDLRKSLQLGLLTGDSIPDITKSIAKHLEGEWETIKYRAEMIARTESSRAYTSGTLTKYQEHGVTKVRWVTDGDPCPICMGLKDLVFYIDNIPFNGPPAHPNCVCTLVPAGDDEAVHDNIIDYMETVAVNNQTVSNIIKDKHVSRPKRIDIFNQLRQEEIGNLNEAEMDILLSKGLGQKELYDGRSHTAKYGRSLGLNVPDHKSAVTDADLVAYSKKIKDIKEQATMHMTYRDLDKGHVKYGYLLPRTDTSNNNYIDIAIYNEKTNMDMVAWRIDKTGLKLYLEKNKYIPLDFKLDDL